MTTSIGGILVLALSYLVGSIPFALLIGKFNGIDIRRHGSGNTGATNVRRVLGKQWGIFCFVLDFAKGLIPVLLVKNMAIGGDLLPMLAAVAAIAGHVWPLYLRFKGGKGVATSLGALLALAPWAVVVAGLAWVVSFYLTRYVSVASLVAALMLPVSAGVLNLLRPGTVSAPILILLTLIGLLIIVRHKTNVIRLCKGEENRFARKGKK
jgi:glycerol-3-phosphate acyltransferase PlsY